MRMAARHLVKDLVGRRPGRRECGLQRRFGSPDQLEALDIAGAPMGDAPMAGLLVVERGGHGNDLIEIEVAARKAVLDKGVERLRRS